MSAEPFHFLVIEDNDDHAQLVLRSLKRCNLLHTASHVDNGSAALDYLSHCGGSSDCRRPDVILLDLNLPKVDGMEVLTRLKEDEKLRSIPVVVLTTSDADADRSRAYQRHANSYLVKPGCFERFRRMMQDLSNYWSTWNRPPKR